MVEIEVKRENGQIVMKKEDFERLMLENASLHYARMNAEKSASLARGVAMLAGAVLILVGLVDLWRGIGQ